MSFRLNKAFFSPRDATIGLLCLCFGFLFLSLLNKGNLSKKHDWVDALSPAVVTEGEPLQGFAFRPNLPPPHLPALWFLKTAQFLPLSEAAAKFDGFSSA